ncbi:hypothetical protein F183_A43560 [Bryobacterales bacterium F-183]|nr:hypothetical protein F183_A43560 [Bryobacterales bacterium F-183]
MPISQPAKFREWLIQGLTDQLIQVLETMAGEKPLVSAQSSTLQFDGDLSAWTSTSSIAEGAKVTFVGSSADCARLGSKVLTAAGLDLDDEETVLGTFRETIDQAFAGLAQQATNLLAREITAGGCKPLTDPSQLQTVREPWAAFTVEFANGDVCRFHVNWNEAYLLGAGTSPGANATEPAIRSVAMEQVSSVAQPSAAASPQRAAGNSASGPEAKNSDLLFDVELPVCVSFGRAYLQLKDVLKLTTGSIVELNRTVSEPVEVIVNNCVIARGEVVVVEGNFGVRIQEVISRQERLRTLH